MDVLRPAGAEELREMVDEAQATRAPVEVVGGGSKRAIARPVEAARMIDVRGLSGIIDHDPAELVLTAACGTPLRDVEQTLERHNQMLAFEPFDHGSLFGNAAAAATIGGIVAANVSGSRRIAAGGARDHLLGFSAVSGHGELFRAGGTLVKNVTGFDLSKLMAGSWGTLAVLTQVTLRLLPRPQTEATLRIHGLSAEQAVKTMAEALGSSAAVSGAAHTPEGTYLRVEGFVPSVDARLKTLSRLFTGLQPCDRLNAEESRRHWAEITSAARMARQAHALWRVTAPPHSGGRLLKTLQPIATDWQLDWGGGLLWIAVKDEGNACAQAVHAAAVAEQGHARLIRASDPVRTAARLTKPACSTALAAVAARIKSAFDPFDILNRGHPGPEF